MASTSSLNMSDLPPIFILPTHMPTEDLHEVEDVLYHAGGRLSYRASEARIFLGKVLQKKRAAFDLRARGLWTQEEPLPSHHSVSKKRKLGLRRGSETKSSSESDGSDRITSPGSKRKRLSSDPPGQSLPELSVHVVVLKLEWLDACVKHDAIQPFGSYLVYTGKIIEKPESEPPSNPVSDGVTYIKAIPESPTQLPSLAQSGDPVTRLSSILERARSDVASNPSRSPSLPYHRRKFGQKSTSPTTTQSPYHPKLHRATTSELEDATTSSKIPPMSSWLIEEHPRPMYSCLRSTGPIEDSPNRHFIGQLTKIKEARLLTLDEIGVRAYSTSIASLAAYPHRIISPVEITRLPGCNEKIATLWLEWHESVSLSEATDSLESADPTTDLHPQRDAQLDHRRTIPIVNELQSNTDLTHLRTFHNIWGVGPDTARRFYFDHGWKDMDDVVEHGWSQLTRAQQIGVKFYEEFQRPIPRHEVEDIARTVLQHARLCRGVRERYWTNDVVEGCNGASKSQAGDPRDFVAVLVGGYRRGKTESGDVDVILSHRDDRLTKDLVVDVVRSLETHGYVTHTLTLHTTTSDRGQQTLPFRAQSSGHGFDSLDKALCVWQDPNFSLPSPSPSSSSAARGPENVVDDDRPPQNPNVHRRVDIIVSAWRTIGCAVLGWSGGTTFQRDIRRWVKREHGWKYDSSGVRDRGTGAVLDLESPKPGDDDDGDDGDGWEDRERRLMERLGIGWRPATERCTG